MATLVLSTVGTILGGPIGGAIGSLLGQSIDQQVLGAGPRHGPRLGDLSVQTSTYGTPIPKIFGTMRVAGSVIWSTDLQEDSQTQGAKGQPDSITYSYSASFAVALSSRPIGGIGRIWADGKLIRTAEGEFTVGTVFRFYDGSESQPVDPLIASIEGVDSAPAYRGTAIAVFEHMQLAEFGNRIPFLTFEIEADPGPVSVGEILSQASEGAIQSDEPALIAGYAAYGASMSDAVAPCVQTYGVPLFDNGRVLSSPATDVITLVDDSMGCAAGSDQRPRSETTQIPARQLPASLSLSYFDPAREYQAGLARASIDAVRGSAERVEFAAVLEAPAAKALAETSLARRWAERDRLSLYLPPEQLALTPGSLIMPPGEADPWRAEKITVDSLTVVAELRPMFNAIDPLAADPGRALPSEGVAPAPTTVELMELPDDGSGTAEAPIVALAASSTSWRTVPLQVDLGEEPFATFSVTRSAILGSAQTVLEVGQASVFDRANSLEVGLINPNDWLESRTDDELVDGANLAMVGNEVLQFGEAVPLGSGRFRLSRLLRGRFGSEWAMTTHETGERFVLLDRTRLRQLDLTSAQIGRRVRATAHGLADDESSSVEIIASGEALRPPSPVHLRASIDADGYLRCTWVRRSRQGWAWLDGVDAPLGCSRELYRVELRGPAGAIEIEVESNEAEFAPSDVTAVGGGALMISVVQVGDLAVSRPTERTISIT